MPLYLLSYDAHFDRDYAALYELMAVWNAERLHESLWLAELLGPAEVIRDFMIRALDGDDSVAVIELAADAQWATTRAQVGGTNWLRQHIPFRHG